MQLINIGFGNIVSAERIISIVSPESAPIKRIVQEAKDSKMAIDATYGRRTRSVIIMDSGHIILSAVQPETIAGRVDTGIDDQRDHRDIERNFYRSDTPQSRHQDIGENEQREGEQNDQHVQPSLPDDRLVSCKKAQQLHREQTADKSKEKTASQPQLQRQTRDFAHRGHPSLSVVLGGQDDVSVAHSYGWLLHQKKDLVYRGRP